MRTCSISFYNKSGTIVEFVVENFFVFLCVPENEAIVGCRKEHDLIGVDTESSDRFLMLSEFLFKVP